MSRITVPTAPAAGGAAPRPVTAEAEVSAAGGIGRSVARLGQAAFGAGTELEQERFTRESARFNTRTFEALSEARLELEQIGDAASLTSAWAERRAALSAALLESADPRHRERFRLTLDDQLARTDAAMAQRGERLRAAAAARAQAEARAARLSETRVDLLQAGNALARAGAGASPDELLGMIEGYEAQLIEAAPITGMKPEDIARELIKVGAEAEKARAARLLREDPGALALEAGGFRFVSASQAEGYITRAQSAVDQELERQRRAAEIATREREQELDAELRAALQITLAGGTHDNEATILTDPEYRQRPGWEEFNDLHDVLRARPGLFTTPPAALRAQLAAEQGRPVSQPWELRRRDMLASVVEQIESDLADDPIAHVARHGIAQISQTPDPASASPTDLIRFLGERRALARALAADWAPDAPLLTREEAELWSAAANRSADPGARSALAASIALALGGPVNADALARTMAQIGADPVFAHVGGLLAEGGGSDSLARQIFEGQRVLDRRDISLPAVPERRSLWFREFNRLFDDGTGTLGDESGARDAVIAAADALYAYRQRQAGASDSRLVETDWMQAAHEILGGTGQRTRAREARGGLAEIRGEPTFLPVGIGHRDATRAIDWMGTTAAMRGVSPVVDAARAHSPEGIVPPGQVRGTADLAEHWRRFSASGTVPVVGNAPMDLYSFSRMRLRAAGGDGYTLTYSVGGYDFVVHDDNGEPWQLDLSAVISAWGAR